MTVIQIFVFLIKTLLYLIENTDMVNDSDSSGDEENAPERIYESNDERLAREAEERKTFKYGPYDPSMSFKECKIIENERGALPLQPSLGALAELRRVR